MFAPLLIALACLSTANAAPLELTHQGRLLDAAGGPVNGTHLITLTLATPGADPYVEEQTLVLSDGYYAVILGADGGLDDARVTSETLLSVAVNGVVLGAPSRLRSVPRAASAASADKRRVSLTGSQLTDGTTLNGWVEDGAQLVLGETGFGAGTQDLLVTPDNSPYVLPSGVHTFRTVTVEAGATLTTTPFNGYEGGFLDIRASGAIQIDGTVDLSGMGYRGGKTVNINPTDQWLPVAMQTGQPGESSVGYGNTLMPYDANGSGGGGGEVDNCSYAAGGGGGGHATAGTPAVSASAVSSGSCAIGLSLIGTSHPVNARSVLARGGRGGTTTSAAVTNHLTLGGGGGASGSDADCAGRRGGYGGNGGGAIGLAGRSVVVNGTLSVAGDVGGDAVNRTVGPCSFGSNNGAGGGGAGGSVRITGQSVAIAGTIDARGGGSGVPKQSQLLGGVGGSGWVGIHGVAVDNSGTINADASAISVRANETTGDGHHAVWTSASLANTVGDTGTIEQVDVFVSGNPGLDIHAWLCASNPSSAVTLPADCSPVATSGAVLDLGDGGPAQNFLRLTLSAPWGSDVGDFRSAAPGTATVPGVVLHGIQLTIAD